MKRYVLIFAILLGCVGCDQVTKMAARDYFQAAPPVSLFNGAVRFQHAENPGAFLSLGATLSEAVRPWFSMGVPAVILVGLLVFLLRSRNLDRRHLLPLALILAGGVGNLIDRLSHGTVTDFMVVGLGPLHTGVFNVADVAISAGALLLLFTNFRNAKNS